MLTLLEYSERYLFLMSEAMREAEELRIWEATFCRGAIAMWDGPPKRPKMQINPTIFRVQLLPGGKWIPA